MKNPKTVYFWWSVGHVYQAEFVRWVIKRMHNGRDDTNKLGVAVLLESDWLFNNVKISYGCKRGQYILRPTIYRFISFV